MSGRPASLLLALCLPALLSATCNPKKTVPQEADALPPEPDPAAEKPAGTVQEGINACPDLEAVAGPLGPAVAPACPGAAPVADPALATSLAALASVHAKGLAIMGPASSVTVHDDPAVLRSAVLQGPPHCYVVVAMCEKEAAAGLSIAAAGATEPLVEAEGPAVRICPSRTGSFHISIAVEKPPLTCVAGLYGD